MDSRSTMGNKKRSQQPCDGPSNKTRCLMGPLEGRVHNKKSSVEPFEYQVDEENPSTQPVEDQMKIFFRIMKTIPLEVKKSDTIKEVRDAFSQIEGVSKVNLKKIFFEGTCLENERKLVDYDIQNGSFINLFLDSGVRTEINIKMPQRGKTITLDVDIRDTIHTLKGKIKNKERISSSQLDLVYLGEELDDSRFLGNYNIDKGSTLYALFRFGDVIQVNVSIERGTRDVNLKLKRWYTVEDVKNMMESLEGIPAGKQKLYLDDVKLENDATLADLNICSGQRLDLVYGMHIFVKTLTGKTLRLIVDRSDTIEYLKESIEMMERFPVNQQRLVFGGKQLQDSCALTDYEIEDGDMIHLVLCLCGC